MPVLLLTAALQPPHIARCPQGTQTHEGVLSQQTMHTLSLMPLGLAAAVRIPVGMAGTYLGRLLLAAGSVKSAVVMGMEGRAGAGLVVT